MSINTPLFAGFESVEEAFAVNKGAPAKFLVLVHGKNEKFFPKLHVLKYPNKFDPELVSAVKGGLVVPSSFLVPMPGRVSTPVPSSGASPAPVSPSSLLKPTWVTAPAARHASVHDEESEEETIPPEASSSVVSSGPAVVATKASPASEDLSDIRKSSSVQDPSVVPSQGQQEILAPASPSSSTESEDYSMSPETVEEGETISAQLSPRGGLKELPFGVPPPLPEYASRPLSKTVPSSPVRVVPPARASAPPSAAPQSTAEVAPKSSPAPRRTVEVVIKSSSAPQPAAVVAPTPSPGSPEPKSSTLGLVPVPPAPLESSSTTVASSTKKIEDFDFIEYKGKKYFPTGLCFPDKVDKLPPVLSESQVNAVLNDFPFDQFDGSPSSTPTLPATFNVPFFSLGPPTVPSPPVPVSQPMAAPQVPVAPSMPPKRPQRPTRVAKSAAKAKSKALAKDEAQYVPDSDSEQSVVESVQSLHLTPLQSSSKGKAPARERSSTPFLPPLEDMSPSVSPSPPTSPFMGPPVGVPSSRPGLFGLSQSYPHVSPSLVTLGLSSQIPSNCYIRPPPSGPCPDLGVYPSHKFSYYENQGRLPSAKKEALARLSSEEVERFNSYVLNVQLSLLSHAGTPLFLGNKDYFFEDMVLMNKLRPGTWERAINTCPTCSTSGLECYYAHPACWRRKCLCCGGGKRCYPIPSRDDRSKGSKKRLQETEAELQKVKQEREDYLRWVESTQVVSHASGLRYKESFVQQQHERVQRMQELHHMFPPAGLAIEAPSSSFAALPGPSSHVGSYAPPPAGRLLIGHQPHTSSTHGDYHPAESERSSVRRRRRSTTPPPSSAKAEVIDDSQPDEHASSKRIRRD